MSGNAFSAWIWSPEHQRHYCWRYGPNGQPEYQWSGLHSGGATSQGQVQHTQYNATPRTTYMNSDQSHSQLNSTQLTQRATARYEQQSGNTGGSREYGQKDEEEDAENDDEAQDEEEEDEEDEEEEQEEAETTRPTMERARPIQSSVPRHDQYYAATQSAAATYASTESNSTFVSPSASPTYTFQRPLPDAIQKTVGGDRPSRHVKTSSDPRVETYEQRLDPSYQRVAARHQAAFFCRGRVFKMLWTEPAGQTNPGKTRGSTHFSVVRFHENAYSEIRRFVVVQNKHTFSQCIPIQTYRRQGTKKLGIIVEDHGMIFTGQAGDPAPALLEGEGIVKQPLRVESKQGEQLESTSRINFGKPYAVEHNVKVVEIGQVAPEHIYLLVTYFQEAMASV